MAVSFRSVFAGVGLVGAEPVVVACDGEHDASVEEPVHMAAAMVVSEKMSLLGQRRLCSRPGGRRRPRPGPG